MALIDTCGRPLGDGRTERDVAMTLEAFHAAREKGVVARPAAVQLPPDTVAEAIAPWLAAFDLICIEFPKFRDGRGFTLARTLRARYRFDGDIRAVGHLLPDQLEALRHCGFSSVRTADEHPPEQWAPASGGEAPILREGESTARGALPLLNRLVSRRFS